MNNAKLQNSQPLGLVEEASNESTDDVLEEPINEGDGEHNEDANGEASDEGYVEPMNESVLDLDKELANEVVQKFRDDGFEDLMNEAKELANEVGIDPTFPKKKRVVRRNKHFDEDMETGAEGSQTPEDNFRITYFIHIIDQALTSLNDTFQQFGLYEEIFGFLFKAKLRSASDENLMEHCTKLESFLEHNQLYDINGKELFGDLRELKAILSKEVTKSIDIIDFLRSYWEDGGFRNAWVAYRILLTIPVTVASAERSFSKLKLIKNYLRTTRSQERLNGLAMISIENELLEKLKYDHLIEEFASKNASSSIFL